MREEEKRSEAFLQMIALSASGAKGEKIYPPDTIDWSKVIQYSQEQGVMSLIGCALLHNSDIVCPEELREQLINAVRMEAGKNLVRRLLSIPGMQRLYGC